MPPQALIFPFHDCPPEPENLEYEARERVEVEHFDKRMNVYSKRIRKAKKNAIGKLKRTFSGTPPFHALLSCTDSNKQPTTAGTACEHRVRTIEILFLSRTQRTISTSFRRQGTVK